MSRLTDDDEYRRDVLDLDAVRRRQSELDPEPALLAAMNCPHCSGDPRGKAIGPAGRYLDLYLRSGLPTKAASFALVAIGLSYLVDTTYVVYRFALEVYARFGQVAVPLSERLY